MEDKPEQMQAQTDIETQIQTEEADQTIKKPTSCSLVVVNSCPLRCKMCHMWKMPRDPHEVSIEEWKQFVLQVREILDGNRELVISGGEPLLKENVLDLVNFATQHGLKTIMPSNGYLIDEAMAEKIAASGLSEIFISLDSFDPKTHDLLRGRPGTFDRVMKAIEYLDRYIDKSKTRINILSVISDINITDIVQQVHMIDRDPRLSGIYFQAIQEPFCSQAGTYWYKQEEYESLWPKNIAYVERVIDELIYLKHERNIMIHNYAEQLEIFKSYFRDPQKRARKGPCYIGDYVVNVNPVGDIFLCCLSIPIGNIRSTDIRRLWFGGKVNVFRQLMHSCTLYCHNMVNCFFKQDEHVSS